MSNETPLDSDRSTPTIYTPLLRDHNINYLQTPYEHRLTSSNGSNENDNSIVSITSSSSHRRPYHYPHDQNNIGRNQLLDEDADASITYNRFKYYTRLRGGGHNGDKLKIPNHVVPYYFYIPRIPLPMPIQIQRNDMSPVRTQSSMVTIFAIWNMLMGTSLLCLPWALHKAGLVMGIALLILMTCICCYTANLIISIPKLAGIRVLEFSDACYHLLGRWAHIISLFSSLTTLIGGCVVYWVLMSNFLYHAGTFLYEVTYQNMTISTNMTEVVCVDDNGVSFKTEMIKNNTIGNSTIPPHDDTFYSYWDLNGTVPFMIALFIAPVITLKSANFFMKFNIVGSLSVIYLLIFAAYKSWSWGAINVNFTDHTSPLYTPIYNWEFPTMTGVLSLALFIHNLIISLLSTQRNPENNRRDLGIAYILVSVTYLSIALLIYLSFPIAKNCLQDNFLNNFESNDILAFVTRVFLLIQIVSLYPLLVYMLRLQVMHLLLPNGTAPGYLHILCLNAVLICLCISFAVYFPRIGTIIRFCGSVSGLVFIFTLPPLAYLKAKKNGGDTISKTETIFHYMIIAIGLCNCFGQFFV